MDQIVKPRSGSAPVDVGNALGIDPSRPARARRSRWPWLVLAIVLIAGAGTWFFYGRTDTAVAYQTVPVERGTITVEVSATGTVEPLTQVEISSELSGVMREVLVDENQRVAKGDVLARLDTARIAAQVERAEGNVQAAQARVEDARITLAENETAFARTEQLAGRGLAANQSLETVTATRDRAAVALETAEANLVVARADLRLQQADLEKSTIYSPIDGIVLTRSINPGQTVAASMSAPVLFVIAENLERMEVKAAIDEADIGMVEKGQPARFTVDAFPDRPFSAEISDISFASLATEGVVTYEARLAVDNSDLLLRPGMTATVNIVTRQADSVLLVPSAAFRFSPAETAERRSFSLRDIFSPPGRRGFGGRGSDRAGGGQALYVLEDGAPVRRRVEIGASNGDMTEIISGLDQGDRVITGTAQAGS
ncbi:MAG: efflux RND transporter periplasmic adaptor subunit [Rhizobiaceae bacterium]|nr:efflux RND transporter periplasmic adaptor subunit [Rhizobiaceae bacterium]